MYETPRHAITYRRQYRKLDDYRRRRSLASDCSALVCGRWDRLLPASGDDRPLFGARIHATEFRLLLYPLRQSQWNLWVEYMGAMSMTNNEINETVAKKLGWTERDPSTNLPHWRAPNGNYHDFIPNYTGSIQAAWEIVESLHPLHGISLTQHLQPPYGWSCTMWTPMTEEPDFTVRADTAPMAIALAFLKLP